nr:unnamed protein product [Digitaria exilis]
MTCWPNFAASGRQRQHSTPAGSASATTPSLITTSITTSPHLRRKGMASLRHLAAGPTCHHHHGVTAATASLQLRRRPSCPRPLRSRLFFTRIYAISSNDIRVGTNVEVDGAPWKH